MLYVIPTPIGNLNDITLRAIETLKSVNCIYAEDTRTTIKLLKHLAIQKPLFAYHMHNEHAIVNDIVSKIKSGLDVGIVSDAGTPGISDPGYLLIKNALDAGVQVCCLPGATAFVPALVASGLPSDKFIFEGFLPVKKGRMTRLQEIATYNKTFILYESPHRLLKTLEQLMQTCGEDRYICVSREISKLFEENFRGTLQQAYAHFSSKAIKGEFVLTVAGSKEKFKATSITETEE